MSTERVGRLSSLDVLYSHAGQQRSGLLLHLLSSRHRPGFPELVRAARSRTFNTHPIVGALVVGALETVLEEGGGRDAPATFERAASTWAPAVASLGDRLFGGALAPVTALVAAHAVVWGSPPVTELLLAFVVVGYVVGQTILYQRLRGLGRGGTPAIMRVLQGRSLERRIVHLSTLGRFLAGALAGALAVAAWKSWGGGGVGFWVWIAGVAAVAVLVRRVGFPPLRLGGWIWFGSAILGLLWAVLRGNA